MVLQIAIGTVLILITTLAAGLAFLGLEQVLIRRGYWFVRRPHAPKLLALMGLAVVAVLGIVTVAVWVWAFVFLWLEIFITLEASVYFSIVAFTTLGFGDILLPQDWRLLAGMAAVNGLLMIGLLGAILVEVLRRVRIIQSEGRDRLG
ncbi:ion channel [Psychromarinibacter sp. C21-152]|uniref:Ion channel n=1 Tax=Psychromarinibacter sediminicola TaxID=3033385 RepID=A0AAE3T7R2_9RHOB|nr:ion channel [Psychromarinibacter sediminicola]MDF0599289.1 ion channel [Psychromarinibacter sediminicola]